MWLVRTFLCARVIHFVLTKVSLKHHIGDECGINILPRSSPVPRRPLFTRCSCHVCASLTIHAHQSCCGRCTLMPQDCTPDKPPAEPSLYVTPAPEYLPTRPGTHNAITRRSRTSQARAVDHTPAPSSARARGPPNIPVSTERSRLPPLTMPPQTLNLPSQQRLLSRQ
ncbi:hypothetical protein NDU88_000133 [Pleurodeles waltl]|uniref:Secreted protein n=1 Tax=Pleurodeles waltl TaxID=8319 RepID=A0AAV7UQS7_PLEWA|nr:hypothetical protein NDU88_000133 [Pleurodeles waltl]